MNAKDIDKLHAAGLISPEQRDAILTHFHLDEDRNRLLQILAILGGLLVSGGIILMIASNWEEIPRLVRLGTGCALMLVFHWGGFRLSRTDSHPALATSLQLIGSMLFLGNIALVGQAYHLSSRLPNAIFLWWFGIAPLAWILRSKAQFILSLAAFGVWMATELSERNSWLYFGGAGERQLLFFAILGVAFVGAGGWLRRSAFPEFGPATEKFGLLTLHIASFPLSLGFFYGSETPSREAWVICGIALALAISTVTLGVGRSPAVPKGQWRWVWTLSLVAMLGLAYAALGLHKEYTSNAWGGIHWFAIPILFCFCLIQAQVGILMRSPFYLNLAITFIGIHLVSAYLQLFGTMFDTGLVFLAGGLLLILLSIFLERKRRSLMKRLKGQEYTSTTPVATP